MRKTDKGLPRQDSEEPFKITLMIIGRKNLTSSSRIISGDRFQRSEENGEWLSFCMLWIPCVPISYPAMGMGRKPRRTSILWHERVSYV
jgi:hypothetical protein